MKESKDKAKKTLKHVWNKVKHGKRNNNQETKEDAIVSCKNDTLNEEIDSNANRTCGTSGNRSGDPRWDDIELISSREQAEEHQGKDDKRNTKRKFKKRVSKYS